MQSGARGKTIETATRKIAIAPNFNFGEIDRKWLITAHPQRMSAKKRSMSLTPLSNISSKNGTPSILEHLADINSINDYFLNNNPAKSIIPQTATGINAAIQKATQIEIPDILQKYISKPTETKQQEIPGVFGQNLPPSDKKFNLQINYFDKPYTPEDIGKMSPQEFSQKETEIMKQVQQGIITNQKTHYQDYNGYRNPVSGDSKIFSAEDIGNLSTDEFTKNEAEINAQIKSIGIPSQKDLETSVSNGGAVYVSPYVRNDGTHVNGYYRSK